MEAISNVVRKDSSKVFSIQQNRLVDFNLYEGEFSGRLFPVVTFYPNPFYSWRSVSELPLRKAVQTRMVSSNSYSFRKKGI